MKIKDLIINAIANKVAKINYDPGIYVQIYTTNVHMVRFCNNKESNVKGMQKIKKYLSMNDLFYVLSALFEDHYIKNIDFKALAKAEAGELGNVATEN